MDKIYCINTTKNKVEITIFEQGILPEIEG